MQDPSTVFLMNPLQEKANSFSKALREMMEFSAQHCFFREGDSERLWLYPDPWDREKRENARKILMSLTNAAEKGYREFRAAIKVVLEV